MRGTHAHRKRGKDMFETIIKIVVLLIAVGVGSAVVYGFWKWTIWTFK